MLIKATLSNAMHPEYGEVTIPFPIKTSEYDRTMEMLANLKIGDAMGRDCKIMELSSPYSILQKLEYSEVNIDELDYLAKRLESFEADQDLQFKAAAFARGVTSIEDFINLIFCSDQATVRLKSTPKCFPRHSSTPAVGTAPSMGRTHTSMTQPRAFCPPC